MARIPTADNTVSIILPAHNEEDVLRSTVQELQDWSTSNDHPLQIIIVEDGCTDATPEISADLAKAHDNVRHIHKEHRLGKGVAVETGFDAAETDIICFMDVDRATPVDCLDDLLQPIEQGTADITVGSRYLSDSDADRNPTRSIMSRGYNALINGLFHTGIADHQCGFKAMRAAVFDELQDDITDGAWFWDAEMLVVAQRQGYTVQEVPVRWEERDDSAVGVIPVSAQLLQGAVRLKSEHLFGDWFPTVQQYAVFAVIGAFGAVINTVLLYLITEFFGVHYMVSGALSIEAAIVVMFFLNNYLTFDTTKHGIRQLADGLVRSNLVRSVGIVIQLALLYALTEYGGIHYVVSNAIAIFIASLATFAGEKTFNWGETLTPDTADSTV